MAGESWVLLPTPDAVLVLARQDGATMLVEGEPEAVVAFFAPMPRGLELVSVTLLQPIDAEEPGELLDALHAAAPVGGFSFSVDRVAGQTGDIAARWRAKFSRVPRTFH